MSNKAVKGATVRRDILESKSRALLAMEDFNQASAIADQEWYFYLNKVSRLLHKWLIIKISPCVTLSNLNHIFKRW